MNILKKILLKSKSKFAIYKKYLSDRYKNNKQKIINLDLFDKKNISENFSQSGFFNQNKVKLVSYSKSILNKASNIKIDFINENKKKKKGYKRKKKNNFKFSDKFSKYIKKINFSNEVFLSLKPNGQIFSKEKFDLFASKLSNKVFKDKTFIFLKDKLINFKNEIKVNKNNKSNLVQDFTDDFVGIFYNENDLYLIPITLKNGETYFNNLIKIDIPTDIIGETKIENIPEFTSIVKDIIEVFGLAEPKLILFLGSSFFTMRSFDENKISSFSNNSEEILSKSPYLAHNTILSSYKVVETNTHGFYRVAYLEKESLDTWAEALEKINNQVVTITSPIFTLLDKISAKSKKEIILLCDIEKFSTTVYLQKDNCELFNTKLPYGSSLYCLEDGKSSQYDMFSIRLKNSLNQIIKNNNYTEDYEIYLTGTGLNLLVNNRDPIDEPFKRVPELISRKYQFNNNKLKDLEERHLSIFEFFSTFCEEIK